MVSKLIPMATKDQVQSQIASIHDHFNTIRNFDIENDLIKSRQLGSDFSFQGCEDLIRSFLSDLEMIVHFELTKVPFASLVKFQTATSHVKSALNNLKTFNPSRENSAAIRSSYMATVQNTLEEWKDASLPIFTLIALQKTQTSDLSEIELLKQELRLTVNQSTAALQSKMEQIEEVLKTARAAAGTTGINAYNVIFGEEARFHFEEAKKWFKYLIFILTLTIVVAGALFSLMFWEKISESTFNSVQFTVSKIVILAIFLVAVSVCIRNYKAHKHNSIVNKHRQNALATFETFVKAAGNDEQTKNAILLQATQSIFSNQNTGYNNSENEGEVTNRIVEIIKSGSKTN